MAQSKFDDAKFNMALIVGAGSGLSASLARLLAKEGIKVALAARSTGDLAALVNETGAQAFACDATQRAEVEKLFADLEAAFEAPDIVIYNASFRTRGPFVDLEPAEVEQSLATTAFGAFLVAQQAARRMLVKQHGAILFTGASASVKGYAQSAPFAMGKFALRGLAQSMARELHPQGIHVAHVVIDGGIASARRTEPPDRPASLLEPDAIAATYLHLIQQPRNAWSTEIALRPWVEKF
jgi:NAD(P)-dependent dehydrogenase (short-subunit alcohol dehydrogenase family)